MRRYQGPRASQSIFLLGLAVAPRVQLGIRAAFWCLVSGSMFPHRDLNGLDQQAKANWIRFTKTKC